MQPIATDPESKRFLMILVGFLGATLVLFSIGFGIYSFFAPSQPLTDEMILAEAFIGLDATLNAHNARINAELSLIIDDNASLSQLMNKGVAEENDLALLLRDEFRGFNWDNELLSLRRYVSRKPWQIGFLEIKNQLPLLAMCDAKREKIRAMLDNPDVDMQLLYKLDQYGFSVDKNDRDNLWGYIHLEEYELARALTGLTLQEIREMDNPPEHTKPDFAGVLNALRSIMKAVEIASRQKELNLRFDAAYIRENVLDTVQTLVQHPQFGLHDTQNVLEILNHQLANWPADAWVFAGERASAVWLYEMARRGRLLDMIAQQDVVVLQELGTLVSVEWSALDNIDTDELYYLTRMSGIIFICNNQERYFERIPSLARWEDELEVKRGDLKSYPILAGSILLRDVRTIMYRLAVDRARTEAWSLALAAALRQQPAYATIHPITGQPYSIRVETDPKSSLQPKSIITIHWLDSEEPITVPGYAGEGVGTISQ
jgi:hypothetical protein